MVFTVVIGKPLKQCLRNFLQQKKVSQNKMFKDICTDINRYKKRDYLLNDKEKEQISFSCDTESLDFLKALWEENKFKEKYVQGERRFVRVSLGEYLSTYLYNYIWEHKDDDVPEKKENGKTLSIYFSFEDLKKLNILRDEEGASEYIKKLIRSEYDTKRSMVLQ